MKRDEIVVVVDTGTRFLFILERKRKKNATPNGDVCCAFFDVPQAHTPRVYADQRGGVRSCNHTGEVLIFEILLKPPPPLSRSLALRVRRYPLQYNALSDAPFTGYSLN